MQKFLTNNIECKFIKNLLLNTYLPLCQTISDDDYIVNGFDYIHNCDIIHCVKSGKISEYASYEVMGHYEFGQYLPQITELFKSKTTYYDSLTHEWLGKYLRCLRDLKYLDLMPFYNCFSNDYIAGLKIKDGRIENNLKKDVKILKIPIELNKTYTIAIDCDSPVMVAPAFLYNDNFIILKDNSENDVDISELIYSEKGNIKKYNHLSFSSPEVYSVNYITSNINIYKQNEKNLYLLIQLPYNNNSSVVILEGDYTRVKYNRYFNIEYIEEIPDNQLNLILLENLKLLLINSQYSYAYSDRLIEYLLWNVICNRDPIQLNIERIQDKLDENAYKKHNYGVWNKKLRAILFDIYKNNDKYLQLDINGYCDKNMEFYLNQEL